jgi:DNA invertase Pin-like site-specific DNA recombinase
MTCYAYIHADGTDIGAFEKSLQMYAKNLNTEVSKLIKDEASIKLHWTERAIGQLLKQIQKHDQIIVLEAHHLACSTSQILEILSVAATNAVTVHFMKYDIALNNKDPHVSTQQILNLISRIESDFVSKRTSQALARRKAAGLPLGRPKGRANKSLKLDKFKEEIEKYLTLGISKASIAKLVDCHPQTLYDWLDRKDLRKDNIH